MSNAARFNAGRNPDGSFRPSKRRKIGAYHDRLVLDDDLDVIHSRATQFNTSRRLVSETPRAAQTGQSAWVASGSWAPEDNNEVGLDPGSEWYDEAMEGDVMEERMPPENNKKKEKKRSRLSVSHSTSWFGVGGLMTSQKRPHIIWKERYRTEYLDEFLRGEGRGDFRREMSCPDCLTRGIVIPGSPDHRCADCFFPDLVCGSCCARRHRQLPFHRIQVHLAHPPTFAGADFLSAIEMERNLLWRCNPQEPWASHTAEPHSITMQKRRTLPRRSSSSSHKWRPRRGIRLLRLRTCFAQAYPASSPWAVSRESENSEDMRLLQPFAAAPPTCADYQGFNVRLLPDAGEVDEQHGAQRAEIKVSTTSAGSPAISALKNVEEGRSLS
jgi:hypothetical protein